ncbi:MAG: transposase [Gammaproteobacteria bacterium]|jgi:putative transposase|nr:transposase [Gammaproteobacteria bacterium]MBT6042086.1 transposase [Gammaproteobacteria bacterium]
MPRIARVVLPNFPHHVTQRGNRRQNVFFSDNDYKAYISIVSKALTKTGTQIWAYCLMPNHVHLIAVPTATDGLSQVFREAHVRYTRMINKRENWQGHLWQERFHSFAMDERHLIAAVRYVELNPVRAGLCSSSDEWRWSSVHAHLNKKDDKLVTVKPMLDLIQGDWKTYLDYTDLDEEIRQIRKHNSTGRPLRGQ